MLPARWVNVGLNEVLLVDLTGVDILEGGDLGVGILAHLHELPSEIDLDSTLGALLKSNLIGVWEVVDELVGRPELNSAARSSGGHEFVLAEKGLEVEGIEVRAFTLVRSGWRVANVGAAAVEVAVVVVTDDSLLLVELVHVRAIVLLSLIELRESLNIFTAVIEASADDKGLVAELFAVAEVQFIGIWVQLLNSCLLNARPWINHGLRTLSLRLEILDVGVQNTEVSLRLKPNEIVRNEGHLEFVGTWVGLHVFDQGSGVGATYRASDKKIIMNGS